MMKKIFNFAKTKYGLVFLFILVGASMFLIGSASKPISFELISHVPATFWGVVSGSIIALLGVIASNSANRTRLEIQLAHDRDLKTLERDLNLRRELYLDSIDAISNGFNMISNIGNIDLPEAEIASSYNEKISSLHKIYIVANPDTAQKFLHLSNEMRVTFLNLIRLRGVLVTMRREITELKSEINKFQLKDQTIFEKLESTFIEKNLSSDDIQKFNNLVIYYGKEREKFVLLHDEKVKKLYELQIQFFEVYELEVTKLRKNLISVIAAIRSELRIPFDEETFLKILEENTATLLEHTKNFIKDSRNQNLGNQQ